MPGEIEKHNKNFEKISLKLNNIKMSHPNIYKMWRNIINQHIERLAGLFDDCDIMLENSQNIDDLSIERIFSLIIVGKYIKDMSI
jgi:hypothetical protein